jgi:hypothetical protein
MADVSLELLGQRMAEMQGDIRSMREENVALRREFYGALSNTIGLLTMTLNDRLTRFEIRFDAQLGALGRDLNEIKTWLTTS